MARPFRVRGGVIGVFLVATIGAVLAAQQRPPPQPPSQPVFRATTHHVAVDVVVTDRNDKVVTDLTKDDFEIRDQNRLQKISDFAFVSVPPANRTIDLDAPTPPPVDVGSNAESPKASRALVFVIDDTGSIEAQDLIPLKRAMAGFLQTLSADDQVAVTYVMHSDLGQDFTNDVGRLIDAVNHRKAAIGLKAFTPGRDRMIVLRNVVETLSAARQARRAIILVGGGGCDPIHIECRDLIQRALRADVPIYTMDPRVFTDGSFRGGIGNIDSPGQRASAEAESTTAKDTMHTLSAATGARAFSSMSDVPRAIREIMAENGNYYLIGFYPEPVVNDGKFHEITVTVKRPGLRVRARSGYLAGAATVKPSTPKRDMTMALGAGLDDPSLPVRAFVAPMAATPRGGTRALVTIELAYPLPEVGTNALNDELRVGILALTPDAKIKASFQRSIQFTGIWKPSARGTFVINEIIDLPTEPLTVRVGVTSRALGKTGTAHVKVDVPDFTDRDLQLSQLVLGSTTSDLDAATGLDVIRGLVPFQPTTARRFARGDSVRVFARAFWRSRDEAIDVAVTVIGGASLPPLRLTLQGTQLRTGQRQAVIDTSLALEDLAPGSYVLRVIASRPTGKPSVREVPFEIK